MHLRVRFDAPRLIHENGRSYAWYDKARVVTVANERIVPEIALKLNLPAQKATMSVVSTQWRVIANDLEKNVRAEASSNTGQTFKAQLEYAGLYRRQPLFVLRVIPVEYNGDRTIRALKELTLDISYPVHSGEQYETRRSRTTQNIFDNPGDETYRLKKVTAIQSNTAMPDYINESVFKLKVDKTGIYKLTSQDLLEAGVPIENWDPQRIAIYNKGKEIPIYVKGGEDGRFDGSDYIEFYATKNEKTFLDQYPDMYADPFTDINVYWLAQKEYAGLRMVDESGAVVNDNYIVPFKFKDTVHFEEDTHREIFGKDPEYISDSADKYDHWFWGNVISAVESRTFTFDLPAPFETGSSVFVRAMLRGVSIYNPSTNPIEGHQASIWLNDQKVGEIEPRDRWRGQKLAQIDNFNSAGLAQSNLVNGTNTLRVDMEQAGLTDIILLNWFEITYDRLYRAKDDFINFNLQKGLYDPSRTTQFQVDGFSDPNIDVYKLGVSKVLNGKVDYYEDSQRFTSYRIIFQDKVYNSDQRYIAVTENAKLKPLSIEPYKPWKEEDPLANILNTTNIADVLIITHPVFDETIKTFKQLKEAQGHTVEVVDVDQIYDIFNYGIKSPFAIKRFIKYAYDYWDASIPLEYVILVGDASYKTKETGASEGDLVPTLMFTTESFGAAPGDIEYTFVSGDDKIPDLHIGRIPAHSAQDLENYINKVAYFQNDNSTGEWHNRALFISGNDESDKEFITHQPVFRTQSRRIINLKMPPNVFERRLNVAKNDTISGFDPQLGSRQELVDYFDDGLTFVNFFGHGGGAIWADKNILDLAGVDNLNNEGKYPFIASMTCFTGAFENPNKEGLAERLIFAENKGAIAVLASASVGWKYNDFAVKWALHDYLWQDNTTFGQAVDMMKIDYWINNVYYTESGYTSTPSHGQLRASMIHQYNLLGDPTLSIKKADQTLTINPSDETPEAGQTINMTVSAPFSSAVGRMEVHDYNNFILDEQTLILEDGKATASYTIPATYSRKQLVFKFYANSGTQEAAGAWVVKVGEPVLKSITPQPFQPKLREGIQFTVKIKPVAPIDYMALRNFRDYNSSGNYGVTVLMEAESDSVWKSSSDHPGFNSAGLKYFELFIRDVDGNVTRYDLQEINVVDNRPDLVLDGSSITLGGDDRLELQFDVTNDSRQSVSGVLIKAFDELGMQTATPFYSEIHNFQAGEVRHVKADLSGTLFQNQQKVRVVVDADYSIEERNEYNNIVEKTLQTNNVWIDFRKGTSSDGVNNDTLAVYDGWGVYVAPNALSASSVLSIEREPITRYIEANDQKDLKYVHTGVSGDSSFFNIRVKNSVAVLQQPLLLLTEFHASLYSTSELSAISFFRFNSDLGLWVRVPSTMKGDRLIASITESGRYGVFSFKDDKAPQIEVTANGRPLRNKMLVRARPALAFLLQDENGIDLTGSLKIKLDGRELDENDIVLPDSIESANSIALLLAPEFERGDHSLEAEIADINGNVQTVERTFSVSASNDLIVHGNYPNPFAESTIISFTNNFTGPLNKLSVSIYTVSGQLIRSKLLPAPENITDNLLDVGYHEMEWDGSDDDGNDVANGVYFALVKAEFKDQFTGKKFNVTKKLKIARLK